MGPAFTPEAGVPQGAPDSPDIFNISTLPLEDLENTPDSYMPWYCDDLHMIIATPCGIRNKTRHRYHTTEALQRQDRFERTRGIMTCPEKSVITTVSRTEKGGPIKYPLQNETVEYKYLASGDTTKILGLNISKFSWTAQHVNKIAINANRIVSLLYSARHLSYDSRLLMVQALVIPTLTYPCTPLNTCSIASFAKLQTPLNRALKFVFKIRYPETPTAKSLIERTKILPINQIIHKRASNIWNKIRLGIAGDSDMYKKLDESELTKTNRNFPSSLKRAQKDLPPPIFCHADITNFNVKNYYNNHNY